MNTVLFGAEVSARPGGGAGEVVASVMDTGVAMDGTAASAGRILAGDALTDVAVGGPMARGAAQQ